MMLRADYSDDERISFDYWRYHSSDVRLNARYQHCHLVKALALELGITLQFLPSYSPNLNLIERLWKFVKKKCLYNVYYATFDDFKKGINDCLNRVETDYKDELDTLMKPKFQNLKKEKLLAL